jgi:hypothetical protein
MLIMKSFNIGSAIIGSMFLLFLTACSGSKLEARLQANPQCKPIFNAKTGSTMPCPDTEKTLSQGIVKQKASPSTKASTSQDIPLVDNQNTASQSMVTAPQVKPALIECKPFLHQKTGSLIPCPGS